MFDFPTNPPAGTTATTPDGAIRSWDGVKWKASQGASGGGDAGNSTVIAQNATIARSLASRFADRYSVEDWLTPGQPDGVTDNRAQLQAAIDAAAGVAQLVIPAAAHPYIVGAAQTNASDTNAGLVIRSNSHLIIEQGATLQMIVYGRQMDILYVPNCSNTIIELYGTLDGNRLNQPGVLGTADSTGNNNVSGGIGGGNCTNLFVIGNNQGKIQNCKNWPLNIGPASNCEVRGISMTDSGNSPGFAGITVWQPVTTGSFYTASSGDIKFVTAGPHGIVVGQTFSYGSAGNPSQYLQGEYVALSVPNANEVHGHVAVPTVGGGAITTGRVGYCNRCYNVGIVDCYIARIPDLGLVLYSGCTGSYIRGCELTQCNSTGPAIFSDSAQPASCIDCEISDCWVHDTYGSGVVVTSNLYGIFHKNSRIFNNTVANCRAGGISIAAADGVEVFGNSVHNSSVLTGVHQTGLLSIGTTALRANVWGNTLRDPNPAVLSSKQTLGALISYNSSTGAISFQTMTPGSGGGASTTPVDHMIRPGDTFMARLPVGTGDYLKLDGFWVATAGTTGDDGSANHLAIINFTVSPGLVFTLNRINFFQTTLAPASTHIVPGTYTSDATGMISVQTAVAHGYPVGYWLVLDGITGSAPPTGGATDFAGVILNGQQLAAAGTTGTTLVFSVTPSVTITVLSGGRVLPACFGIIISGADEGGTLTAPGTGPDYARVSGNRIGDYQSPQSMVCNIGGVWGLNAAADGNYFGPRRASDPDVSDYNKSGLTGFNYDLTNNTAVVNMTMTGMLTFGTNAGAISRYLPPQGLTPSWNYSSGRGEVDFFCAQSGGAPGGFIFYQVQIIQVAPTGSTYDPVTGIVTLITRVAHTVLPGGLFTLKSVTGTDTTDGSTDVARLAGAHIANSDAAGTTLTFNAPLNMTIQTITGGTIVPAHTGGGLVNTGVGINGALFANDGYGNSQLGGALVHGMKYVTGAIATGNTVTVPQHTSMVMIRNAASIANLTIVMPAAAASQYNDGQEMELNFQNPVTTLAWSGATVSGQPTTITTAAASINFIRSGTTWYRRIMM